MKEKIHSFHLTILVIMLQQGVVIFSLPRLLAQYMGYNGWASLFIISAIVLLNIYIISIVYRMSNGRSIFLIIEESIPKFLSYPLYILLISLWCFIGCLIIKNYIFILQSSVLRTLHPMFIKAIIDVVLYTLLIKSIYNISKATTVFFGCIVWSAVLYIYFIADFRFENLTPFFFEEHTDVFFGGLTIMNAFTGYELVLFLFPYYANKKVSFFKAVSRGHIYSTIVYLSISIIAFGFYSFEKLKFMQYPIIDMLAYIKIPVVERIENIIFCLYLLTSLIGITMFFWAALQTTQRILPKANTKMTAAILIILGYIFSWIPNTANQIEQWLNFLGISEITVSFGLPLLLIIILLVRKGVKRNA